MDNFIEIKNEYEKYQYVLFYENLNDLLLKGVWFCKMKFMSISLNLDIWNVLIIVKVERWKILFF